MIQENEKTNLHLKTAQIIALGFAGVILAGAFLLWLPVSSAQGVTTSFWDALFTACTSVCVTGLVTVSTAANWSVFGKAVILLLIQLGGFGVVTCMTLVLLIMGRRLSVGNRKLIRDTYNLDSMSGLAGIITRIVKGTLIVEGIGAVLHCFVFIPRFGFVKGLAVSVFHAVSAFCNAGMDIIGENSLADYAMNPIVNITTMFLIIMGGLGYLVWWELKSAARKFWKREQPFWHILLGMSLHTKIVLVSTAVLILGGAVFIALPEYFLQGSMKDFGFGKICVTSLFQSVTCRTAGFFTIPQEEMTESGAMISMLLMFVGGSPMGTAGGMKTTTIFILLFTCSSFLKGKQDTEVFARRIPSDNIRTALVVVVVGLSVLFCSAVALTAVTDAPFLDVLYETASAVGTVGLSRGLTPRLSTAGKLIIIVTMYIGRIGPVTLATALTVKSSAESVKVRLPVKKVLIG
ncbi:MAG: TrkH family potassium uptake protein [Lachnospiraceae bacterium]|jgi:trk system potassium uptake protein TrkH